MIRNDFSTNASIVIYGPIEPVTVRLISSLERQCDSVHVVDNSPIHIADRNRSRLSHIQRIVFHSLSNNPGYGAAHNHALGDLPVSKNVVSLIVNPDIEIEDNTVEILSRFFEDPDVGLVMPRVVYPDGTLQLLGRRAPSPPDVLHRIAKPYLRFKAGSYELANLHWSHSVRVPIVSGCFMAIRSTVFARIGGFDERFFMYFEDYDLSRRAASASTVVAANIPTVIHHHGNASRRSWSMALVHLRSAITYFNKWGWLRDTERTRLNEQIGYYYPVSGANT